MGRNTQELTFDERRRRQKSRCRAAAPEGRREIDNRMAWDIVPDFVKPDDLLAERFLGEVASAAVYCATCGYTPAQMVLLERFATVWRNRDTESQAWTLFMHDLILTAKRLTGHAKYDDIVDSYKDNFKFWMLVVGLKVFGGTKLIEAMLCEAGYNSIKLRGVPPPGAETSIQAVA